MVGLFPMPEWLAEKLGSLRIPEPDRVIKRRRDKDPSGGIELNVVQSIRVTQGRHYRSAGIDVPNHRRSVAG